MEKRVAVNPGDKFTYFTVLQELEQQGYIRMVLCACKCGERRAVPLIALRRGRRRSCGCLRSEMTIKRQTKHGRGNEDRTYKSWMAMRNRCSPASRKSSSRLRRLYGHVSISTRWDSFENFLSDMGERPPNTSLDRINPYGNYEPGNCRWADRKTQAMNRRNVLEKEKRNAR